MFRINFFYNSQFQQPLFNRPTHKEIGFLLANLGRLNKALYEAMNNQVDSALNRILDSKDEITKQIKPGLLNKIVMQYQSLMKNSFILYSQEAKSSDAVFLKFSMFSSLDEQNRLLEWSYKDLNYICLYGTLDKLLFGLKRVMEKSLSAYQHFEGAKHTKTDHFKSIYVAISKQFYALQDRIREENNLSSRSTVEGSYKPPVIETFR